MNIVRTIGPLNLWAFKVGDRVEVGKALGTVTKVWEDGNNGLPFRVKFDGGLVWSHSADDLSLISAAPTAILTDGDVVMARDAVDRARASLELAAKSANNPDQSRLFRLHALGLREALEAAR